MAENRNTYKLEEGDLGEVQIADEVVAIIAGLADCGALLGFAATREYGGYRQQHEQSQKQAQTFC